MDVHISLWDFGSLIYSVWEANSHVLLFNLIFSLKVIYHVCAIEEC